jgi:hypothetical protein
VFGQLPCNSSLKKDDVRCQREIHDPTNEIDKKLKKYFVTDDMIAVLESN